MPNEHRAPVEWRQTAAALCLMVFFSGRVSAQEGLPHLQQITLTGAEVVDGPALFSQILSITAGPDGEMYVLDACAPRIRVFDRSGTCIITAGTDGDGPGETRLPITLALAEDGSFTVLDMRLNRMTFFGPDGSLRDTRPVPGTGSSALRSAVSSHSDGSLYAVHLDFSTFSTVISKLSSSGGEREEVMRVEEWPLKEDGSPAMFYPVAAGPAGTFAVGDGLVEYEVRIFDRQGQHLRTIEREIERTRKNEEEIEQEERFLEQGAARIVREGGRAAAPTRPEVEELKHHFYADALRFDARGRLWVLTGRGDDSRSIFDLFSPEGDFLGELTVDRRIRQYDLCGCWLAASGFTPEGVPVAVLYRIDPAPGDTPL